MWFCAPTSFAVSLASTEAGRFCQFDSGSNRVCHGSRIEVWVRQEEICAFLPTHGGCRATRSTVIYGMALLGKTANSLVDFVGSQSRIHEKWSSAVGTMVGFLAELLHDFWRPFTSYIELMIAILAGYTERFGLEPAKKYQRLPSQDLDKCEGLLRTDV